jgi:hypothetical protein
MVDEPEEKLTLAPNRELIEAIVRRDSKNRPAVHKAYEERNRRAEEAWKNPPQATEVWGIADDPAEKAAVALHQAIMAYHQSDIGPLLAAIRSPDVALDRESLARLFELVVYSPRRRLKAGGSGAYLGKWKNPKMVAALMARIKLDVWREQNGKADVPRSVRDGIVDEIVDPMPAYGRLSAQGQDKFKTTVHGLIDKAKDRRL